MPKIHHPLLCKSLDSKLLQTQIDHVAAGKCDTESVEWNMRARHYLQLIEQLACEIEKNGDYLDISDLLLPNVVHLIKKHRDNQDRGMRTSINALEIGLLVLPGFDPQCLRNDSPMFSQATAEQWLLSLGHMHLIVDAQEKFLLMLLSQAYSRDWVQEMVQDAQK